MKEMMKLAMKIRMTSLIVLASLMLTVAPANAQDATAGGPDGPLTDLYIVLGAGAAGAILGLSTLSFVDEPTKNLKNVSMGAAIGIILGVGIVIYNQATKTSTKMYSADPTPLTSEQFAQVSKLDFNKQTTFDSYRQNEWVNFTTSF